MAYTFLCSYKQMAGALYKAWRMFVFLFLLATNHGDRAVALQQHENLSRIRAS
jgi:hypothetical protein